MTLSVSRLYSINDRMINEYGTIVEWELAGDAEVLSENLHLYHFVHHKSDMT
jgi:hypothetical protein